MSWIDDIKDRNIEFESSSSYNPGLPQKGWYDKRARENNAPYDFVYHIYDRNGKKRRFILDRELAALVNTPNPQDVEKMRAAGITPVAEIQFPHRELEAGETVEYGPFNEIIIKKQVDVFENSELLRLVREIHKKIIG